MLVRATIIKMDSAGNTISETLVTDDTYGMYYSFGTLKPGMFAFIAEWYKIASGLGFGYYKINISADNLVPNEVFNQDSPTFRLLPFSCEAAHTNR